MNYLTKSNLNNVKKVIEWLQYMKETIDISKMPMKIIGIFDGHIGCSIVFNGSITGFVIEYKMDNPKYKGMYTDYDQAISDMEKLITKYAPIDWWEKE